MSQKLIEESVDYMNGEVFWFDFAAGTIGGLLFSLVALVLFLPVFAVKKGSRQR